MEDGRHSGLSGLSGLSGFSGLFGFSGSFGLSHWARDSCSSAISLIIGNYLAEEYH